MTYRPAAEFYGPPLKARLVAFVHAGVAVGIAALVYFVERGPTDSALYHYMFSTKHMVDTHVAAFAFAMSSVFSILRDGMRGVKIRADWIEYREMVSAVWPRVRRYRWAQIDRVVFEPSGAISLDLWDGRREILPDVRAMESLRQVLERLATARAIPVHGGVGVDDLETDPELA
jgi:hypothetical protein